MSWTILYRRVKSSETIGITPPNIILIGDCNYARARDIFASKFPNCKDVYDGNEDQGSLSGSCYNWYFVGGKARSPSCEFQCSIFRKAGLGTEFDLVEMIMSPDVLIIWSNERVRSVAFRGGCPVLCDD